MEKYKKTIGIIGLIISIIFIFLVIKRGEKREKELKSDFILTNANIYASHITKIGFIVDYKFEVYSLFVEGSNTYEINSSDKYKLVNRYFPVVYSKNNPENCDILIFPDDFKKYNIPFPDSLNWVLSIE
jgi:hypothetical protein